MKFASISFTSPETSRDFDAGRDVPSGTLNVGQSVSVWLSNRINGFQIYCPVKFDGFLNWLYSELVHTIAASNSWIKFS